MDLVYFTTRVPDTSDTSTRRMRRVLHEQHKCKTSEKNFHTPVLAIWQMKDHKERNSFLPGTTFWKCLVPMPKCVWKVQPQKLNHQKVTHWIVAANDLARSCIITHSSTASFLIKTTLCETNNILFSENYWKLGKMNARVWNLK